MGETGRRWRPEDGDDLGAWLLQAGLAFVFAYASLSTLVDPRRFEIYVPSWMTMPGMGNVLRCFACFELLLAAALLSRRFARPAALAAALTLLAITVANPGAFGILFRNVAIACAALALAVSAPARAARAGVVPGPLHHRAPANLLLRRRRP